MDFVTILPSHFIPYERTYKFGSTDERTCEFGSRYKHTYERSYKFLSTYKHTYKRTYKFGSTYKHSYMRFLPRDPTFVISFWERILSALVMLLLSRKTEIIFDSLKRLANKDTKLWDLTEHTTLFAYLDK